MTMVINNEPWFVGKDVAMMLGYVFPRRALYNHVDEEDKTTVLIQHPGSNYKMVLTTRARRSSSMSLVFMHWFFPLSFHRRGSSSVGWQARCLGMRNQKILSQGMWMQKIKGGRDSRPQVKEEDKPHSWFPNLVLIIKARQCSSTRAVFTLSFFPQSFQRRRILSVEWH